MKQTFWQKITNFFRRMICKLFKHTYGCCGNIFKNCRRCEITSSKKLHKMLKKKPNKNSEKYVKEYLKNDIKVTEELFNEKK